MIHVLGTEPNPSQRQAFSNSQTHRTSKADPTNKRRRTRECYWMSRNSKEPPGSSPERKETGDPPSAQGSSLSVPTRRSGPPYPSCFWVVDAQKTCVRVWERCVLYWTRGVWFRKCVPPLGERREAQRPRREALLVVKQEPFQGT